MRIARENDIDEYMLSNLTGYGRSKQEVLKRAERRKNSELQDKKRDESYIERIYCKMDGKINWLFIEQKPRFSGVSNEINSSA